MTTLTKTLISKPFFLNKHIYVSNQIPLTLTASVTLYLKSGITNTGGEQSHSAKRVAGLILKQQLRLNHLRIKNFSSVDDQCNEQHGTTFSL